MFKKIIVIAETSEVSQHSQYNLVFYLEHFEESTNTNLIVDMIYFPSTTGH